LLLLLLLGRCSVCRGVFSLRKPHAHHNVDSRARLPRNRNGGASRGECQMASRPKHVRCFATPTIYHKRGWGSRSRDPGRPADVRIACFVIAQRPRYRSRHADARAHADARGTKRTALRDPEIVVLYHVQTLQGSIDRQCGAQTAGPTTQVAQRRLRAPCEH
jgi:hypothetical protein